METFVEVDNMLLAYLIFGLTLVRCSGLAVFAPFFGAEQFPVRVRVLLAVFLAVPMFPLAAGGAVIPPRLGMPELGVLALQELSIGIVIGFMASLVFMSAQLAGQLIGQQVGFAMANIVDPLTGLDVSIIGFFKMNLALVVFVVANLHLGMIWVLKLSYDHMGVGGLAFQTAVRPLPQIAAVEGHTLFVNALQLAIPVLMVMLLNSVVEGFVTRTMPQMNIMVLGLPLRVALGITLLMLLTPSLVTVMVVEMETMLYHVREAVRVLGDSA